MTKIILRATLVLAAIGLAHVATGTQDALAQQTCNGGDNAYVVCNHPTTGKLVVSCGNGLYTTYPANTQDVDDRRTSGLCQSLSQVGSPPKLPKKDQAKAPAKAN